MKKDFIKNYNKENPGYQITGIKKMELYENGNNSLNDVYATFSERKLAAWEHILAVYKPNRILAVNGNKIAFTVLLLAENGDFLYITKDNNWLIKND